MLTLMLCTIGIGNAWGTTETSTFTDKNLSVGDGEPEWTGTNASAFESASPSRGLQYSATNGTTQSFTSTAFRGKTVKSVSVVASRNKSYNVTLSVTVNGTTLGSGDTGANNTNNATLTTSDDTGILCNATTGNVIVTLSTGGPSSKAGSLYVKSISVTYTSSGGSTYTVTYALNGGGGTTPTESAKASGAEFTLHDGTTNITPPSGKLFSAWNDGTSNYAGGATYTMPSSNVTLTAQWVNAYTITYDLNGGTGTTPTESAKASGATFTLHDGTTGITPPSGKVFSKWNDGTSNYDAGATYTMPSSNVTLTAQWADPTYYVLIEDADDIEEGSYLIVYNNTYALNTHYGNVNANTYATYTDISSYYSSKKILSNATTDALAYTIEETTNGYSISHVESSTTYYLGNSSNNTGAYLRWDNPFTASTDEWTLGVNSIVSARNSDYAIRWNNNSGSYRFAIYGPTGQSAIQLFKKEQADAKYTVTYYSNDATSGSVPTDGTEYDRNGTVTILGNTGNLAKTGWTFAGWNTAADGSGTPYTVGSTFSITSNVRLYAMWTCTVTWSVNENTTACSPETVTYNSSGCKVETVPTPDPNNYCGDVFVGWYNTADYDSNTAPDADDIFTNVAGSPNIDGDVTFYAVFADYAAE